MSNTDTWHLQKQIEVLTKQLEAANIALSTRFHMDLNILDDLLELAKQASDSKLAVKVLMSCSFPIEKRELAIKLVALTNQLEK